jgi:CheY-like chemotaxis protein
LSEKILHTVLVVEDNDEIGANMSAVLNKRGHQVVRALNAEQAILMAERNRPAMILTDLELPTFDILMNLLRAHDDLKNMVVAIIDINNPTIHDKTVNVLSDFEALDALIQSSHQALPN